MDSSSNQDKVLFSHLLLEWYFKHARTLPWRGISDAYAVWVSEIMLQQTRVDTVIPYFTRWMGTFPTIKTLAAASEEQVLSLWEGLGYYSRARNLHKAARLIMEKFDGSLPQDPRSLQNLPGIGRYTAAAITSIAYGKDEAVVDGNVKRVLARVFDLSDPVNTPNGEKTVWKLAEELLPHGRAGDYNQALMDLGATLCTPQSPQCETCPVNTLCLANKHQQQNERPVMLQKGPIPHLTVCAAVMLKEGKVFIARRPSKGLLGGLWEFPGGKVETGESLQDALKREIREELAAEIEVGSCLGVYQHAYTHFKVTLHAFFADPLSSQPTPLEASEIRWVNIEELTSFPMGKIDRHISQDLIQKNRSQQ